MTSGVDGSPGTSSVLRGRSILVTGATGSFGHAFVRRALDSGARRVVAFSRDELKQAQMAALFPDERMRFFVGDVRDLDRLHSAMRGVDTVMHAAAMKRIETCEANPDEAVRTNVLGTVNVAKAAIHEGVTRAVFLSTDKAPNAATLYGATKFCAERLWNASNVLAAGTPTRLSAVRYGNVLGSRGSVLDVFRKQALAGGPFTVTHSDCTRFWMTIEQAVDLVLLALQTMRGGEVFVGKVPSAPIVRLAEAIAPALSYTTTGLRAAERLHETLISSDEARTCYDAGTHFILEPEERTWGDVAPLPFPKVAADFSYRSDTNPEQLSVAAMRELIAA